jgi:hypothetical protein
LNVEFDRGTLSTMRILSAVTLLTFLSMPTSASAQPSQTPPGPPGPPQTYSRWSSFHQRYGLALGVSFGFGGMSSGKGPLRCIECDDKPLSGNFDVHVGGMLSPQLALMAELGWAMQRIDGDYADYLYQVQLLGVVKYWILPQLWVKGGLGVSSVGIQYNDVIYDDGFDTIVATDEDELSTGFGIMGAIGYEVFSAPFFAIDVLVRGQSGNYKHDLDQRVNALHVELGFSFY